MKIVTQVILVLAIMSGPVFAEGNPDKGKKLFSKCKACHMVGEKAKNRVGPELNGIVGASAGAVEGFKYSKALTAQAEAGLVWDEASLSEFLANPKKFMPGTKMSFKGFRKEEQLADIVSYLATFN
ncbi:cytochrome c family protein [Sulfitobacter sp. SK012]|uniref:c-type cytochrome n=1 Tax=Sulfitobacter sp. SK012 TaxID=1389005 RepID=UPI000E0AB32B|nr:cytochrome c family protein [Sulfitobacter sp. SK012]AXI48179.1 cytochrome c family protein [Sulfitobacter sp. SK012]